MQCRHGRLKLTQDQILGSLAVSINPDGSFKAFQQQNNALAPQYRACSIVITDNVPWSAPLMQPDPNCRFAPGAMIPVIDPMRCEAKGPCVPICPYDVLDIGTVPAEKKAMLPVIGRLKLFVHGGKQAFVLDANACRGCGLCVTACPEKAITLRKCSLGPG